MTRNARLISKKHGIDFIDIPGLFDGDIVILPDERFNYGEPVLSPSGFCKIKLLS